MTRFSCQDWIFGSSSIMDLRASRSTASLSSGLRSDVWEGCLGIVSAGVVRFPANSMPLGDGPTIIKLHSLATPQHLPVFRVLCSPLSPHSRLCSCGLISDWSSRNISFTTTAPLVLDADFGHSLHDDSALWQEERQHTAPTARHEMPLVQTWRCAIECQDLAVTR